jgi:hypothetical protein
MAFTSKDAAKSYWRANVRLLLILLAIWFTVSFICGILLIEPLNPPTPGRVAGTYRLEWSVQVSYVDEHETVHETVDDAEYAVDME